MSVLSDAIYEFGEELEFFAGQAYRLAIKIEELESDRDEWKQLAEQPNEKVAELTRQRDGFAAANEVLREKLLIELGYAKAAEDDP